MTTSLCWSHKGSSLGTCYKYMDSQNSIFGQCMRQVHTRSMFLSGIVYACSFQTAHVQFWNRTCNYITADPRSITRTVHVASSQPVHVPFLNSASSQRLSGSFRDRIGSQPLLAWGRGRIFSGVSPEARLRISFSRRSLSSTSSPAAGSSPERRGWSIRVLPLLSPPRVREDGTASTTKSAEMFLLQYILTKNKINLKECKLIWKCRGLYIGPKNKFFAPLPFESDIFSPTSTSQN